MTLELVCFAFVLATVLAAAIRDVRTGHIPNWITLPGLFIGPALHAIRGGLFGFFESVFAILVCGGVPYLMFRKGAIGGGDVKLFASIGALAGLRLGLEVEFFSLIAAALFAMGQLAFRGKLLRTLGNAGQLMINPLLPKKRRKEIQPEATSMVRLGAAVAVATVYVGFDHYYTWVMPP